MASDDDGGASDGRITEYDQFREATAHKPLTPPAPQPQTWWLVPFILLTAAGGHASGHALMPAAPARCCPSQPPDRANIEQYV